MKLLRTVTYANAPAIGVQFATIEEDQAGTHVQLHFLEERYNYTTQQTEVVPYVYHAWATDQPRHTAADILKCAQDLLGKYACRAKYFGPMVYTVTEAPTEQAATAPESATLPTNYMSIFFALAARLDRRRQVRKSASIRLWYGRRFNAAFGYGLPGTYPV